MGISRSRPLLFGTTMDVLNCLHPFNCSKSNVSAKWSTEFNQKHCQEFNRQIDEIWTSKLLANSRLYNDSKFRLQSWVQEDKSLVLNIGLTSYKAFIGTNCSPTKELIARKGIEDFGSSMAYMANPLGIGVLVKTSDSKMVFIKRSTWCAEEPGALDVPGGHPEPSAILKGCEPNEELLNSKAIVDEIFASGINEVRDEVNIDEKDLKKLKIIGLFQNPTTAGRPSVIFFTHCKLTSDIIREKYKTGKQEEADESSDIIFIPESDILSNLSKKEFYQKLTPGAEAAINLYQKLIQ